MFNIRWFLRAKQMAENPPSWGRVKLVFGVIAVCLIIVAIERFVGWPDWLSTESIRLRPVR